MRPQDFLPITSPSDITPDLTGRVITITGHRPANLPTGYGTTTDALLLACADRWVRALQPRFVVTGMALGFDQAIAETCARLDVEFHAAIPCDDYERRWPEEARRKYHDLRVRATSEIIVCPGPYHPDANQRRNEFMVDTAARQRGLVLALWKGSPGGTRNCLSYSLRYQLLRLNAWKDYLRPSDT
jgi:hypothetical protein